MTATVRNILINPRLLATLLLGFSAGLPFVLTGSTLQAWFTDAKVDLTLVGSLTLIGAPYTWKFLWSPFLDFYQVPKLGLRKGWIMLMQMTIAIGLFCLANLNPATNTYAVWMLAFLLATLTATQDIAIDAYRTDILHDNERGLGAAYYVFTYRLAAIVSGALALVFADYFGWRLTYECCAGLMLLLMLLTSRTPNITHQIATDKTIWRTMQVALTDLLSRENIIALLLFVCLYKLGDALALSLMTNFLMNVLGFTKTEIGIAYKTAGFIAAILGAIVGGAILTRRSLYFGLIAFGLAQAFSNLMFVVLAVSSKSFSLMAAALFIENFCGGLSTAAFFAFLMSMCNKKYTATQYALLSAVASLGRVYLGPVAAYLVAHLGWTLFYVWAFILSFAGVFILLLVNDKIMTYEQPIEETV